MLLEEGSDDQGSYGCENGLYRMSMNGIGTTEIDHFLPGTPIASVRVEADVRKASGGEEVFGVECVSSAARDDAYQFIISESTGRFGIGKVATGSVRVLSYGPASNASLQRVGYKHIVSVCRSHAGGVDLELWVDGVELLTFTDPSGFSSYEAIGFYVDSLGTGVDVEFDNATSTIS